MERDVVREHGAAAGLRIAAVGAGALGSAVLRVLAEAGLRDVLLVDPDGVEERNLRLSPFLREAAEHCAGEILGLPKAELLAAEARGRWGLPWRALRAEIADTGWQLLQDRDLLLCCTDSALSRAETAWTARVLGKPLVEAGVFGGGVAEFRVSWFPAALGSACYLCGMTEARRAQVLAYGASATLGCAPLEDAPAMTATLETLDRAGRCVGELVERFAEGGLSDEASAAVRGRQAGEGWDVTRLELLRSASCPWHEPVACELVALPWEVPLRESLASVGDGVVLQLAWPVCTVARCGSCGRLCEPMVRVAWARRGFPCPGCGTTGLEPVSCVRSVRRQDSVAGFSPRQLGLPASHVHLLRKAVRERSSVERTMT